MQLTHQVISNDKPSNDIKCINKNTTSLTTIYLTLRVPALFHEKDVNSINFYMLLLSSITRNRMYKKTPKTYSYCCSWCLYEILYTNPLNINVSCTLDNHISFLCLPVWSNGAHFTSILDEFCEGVYVHLESKIQWELREGQSAYNTWNSLLTAWSTQHDCTWFLGR